MDITRLVLRPLMFLLTPLGTGTPRSDPSLRRHLKHIISLKHIKKKKTSTLWTLSVCVSPLTKFLSLGPVRVRFWYERDYVVKSRIKSYSYFYMFYSYDFSHCRGMSIRDSLYNHHRLGVLRNPVRSTHNMSEYLFLCESHQIH